MEAHAKYLASRGYDWRELVAQYDIRFTGPIAYVDTPRGKIHYRWRIIIPVYVDGMMVNFTSRDITGHSEARYKSAPDDIANMPGGAVVYNLDNVEQGGRIALMEGPFDVWRVGPGAVGMLGTIFTEEQLLLICNKQPSRVYVVYDSGASDVAKQLGRIMIRLVPRVDYLWLDPGTDPDTLSLMDLNRIRRLLAI
jgi:DNA primase